MFLLGALFGFVLKLATDAYGEDFASTLVRRWHELILGGLPPKEREFKLGELDSYLFEQAEADRARGYKPAEVGVRTLGRLLRGMRADIGSRLVCLPCFIALLLQTIGLPPLVAAWNYWALSAVRGTTDKVFDAVWHAAFTSMPEVVALAAILAGTLAFVLATIVVWWLTTRLYFRQAFGIPSKNAVKVWVSVRGHLVEVAAFQYLWQAEAFVDEVRSMNASGLEMPHLLGRPELLSIVR
jgi:hypothetical protein